MSRKPDHAKGDLVIVKGYDVQYAAVALEPSDATSTKVKLDDDRVWRVANVLLRPATVEQHDRVRKTGRA